MTSNPTILPDSPVPIHQEESIKTDSNKIADIIDLKFCAITAIAVPVLFFIGFGVLSLAYDYPAVLDKSVTEVFESFYKNPKQAWFWAMTMLAGLLFVGLCLAMNRVLALKNSLYQFTCACGILGGLFQIMDLSFWTFMMPVWSAYNAESGQVIISEATAAVYWGLHEYLGNVIGLWLATFLNGVWAIGIGCAMVKRDDLSKWYGWAGIVSGALFVLSNVAYPFQFNLWALINTIGFGVWSLWLGFFGLKILRSRELFIKL